MRGAVLPRSWVQQRPVPPQPIPLTFRDAQAGALVLAGSVTGEGPVLFTPAHGRRLPLMRGIRDLRGMRGYTRANSFTAPVFGDARTGALIFGGTSSEGVTFSNTQTGTLILGGSVTGEGPVLFTPPHGRQLPLMRGIRDKPAMRRYTRTNSFAAPVFSDTRTGTLILSGSVTGEGPVLAPTPASRRLLVQTWAQQRRIPPRPTGQFPVLFSDMRSGTLIFRGASTETNTLPAGPTTSVTIGTFFKVGP